MINSGLKKSKLINTSKPQKQEDGEIPLMEKARFITRFFLSFFKGMCSMADLHNVRLQWDVEVKMLIAVKSGSRFSKMIGAKDKHLSITNMELLVNPIERD